jgi:hypothetical protein
LKRKGLTAGIILLFIGVAIAPSITLISALPSDDKNLIQSSYQTRLDSIIWDNYGFDGSTGWGWASQWDDNYPFQCQTADDFLLTNNSLITGVHWWGWFGGDIPWPNPIDINILFYDDDGTGTMPTGAGMEDPTSTALAVYNILEVYGISVHPGDPFNCIYEYNITLPTPFFVSANTKYWIAIQGNLTYPPQWGWWTNGINPDQLHIPVQGFPLLGTEYWTDLYLDGDMAFQLYGEHAFPPSPPVIHGPNTGEIYIEYQFWTDPITDPAGDSLYIRWDWDDGNITDWLGPYSSGSTVSASHEWDDAGVYDIRAELNGMAGSSGWSNPHTITIIRNQPPVANFTYTIEALSVSFDASSSYDPDGEILIWHWTFGDGASGQGQTINHTYTQPGRYNVILTIVDDHSQEDVLTKEITVQPLPFPAFFAGFITDLKYIGGDGLSFKATLVVFVLLDPIQIGRVIPQEQIWISQEYHGYLGQKIIFGRFTVIASEYP